MNAIIPKFLLNEEDIITLKDKGIKLDEGNQIVGKYKVPCYRFYNISETEIFDELDSHMLLENNNKADITGYSSRVASVLFLKIRQATALKDKEQKVIASCSLLAAVNSLASININQAKRFLPLIRGMV